jgi:hypothetical protein
MENEEIDDPVGFIGALGHLNGASIDSVALNVVEQILYLIVDDLHANLEGRPDYPGERPCALVFFNVGGLRFDIDASDGLRIAELRITEGTDPQNPFLLDIDLNIGGKGKNRHISAQFAALEIEDIDD